MSDSLDPADAIYEGATEGVKRLLAFVLVTAGAAMLGFNLHQVPAHIAAISRNGIGAAFEAIKQFDPGSPILWMLMMLHSTVIWYLLPFLALYGWLLFRLWLGSDMFGILFVLALIHPIHVFIYAQRTDPLAIGDLILASCVLFVCEIVLAGLILWWRNVSENAPAPPMETEPEL